MATRAGNSWLSDKGLSYQRLPEATPNENRQMDVVRGIGQFYGDRYGSMSGVKNTLATDPIGAAADVASLLSGGEAAVGRLGATGLSKGLGVASKLSNPVTPLVGAARVVGPAVPAVTKALLGATTGTSSDTIGEAYRASRAGGSEKKAFLDNLRGNESQDAVIGQARSAVKNIADARRTQYQNDMRAIGANKTPIDFNPIEQKMQDVVDSAFYKSHQKASPETMAKLRAMGDKIDEWSRDPSIHDAEGIDALKQVIDDMMPSFTEAGNSERVVTAVRNAIKDEIVKQVPEYSQAMKSFETSKSAQNEIERSLSLRKGNTTDQALRKLQSLTRNNANTNYGGRVKSADILKNAGAGELMPSLAGQALGTAMPRGIMKSVAGAGLLSGAALLNPAILAALPLTSPRLIGELSAATGSTAKQLSRLPKPSRKALLISRALGGGGLLGQQSQK
jgi:hypothetical protein